jgi:hypothetical protein
VCKVPLDLDLDLIVGEVLGSWVAVGALEGAVDLKPGIAPAAVFGVGVSCGLPSTLPLRRACSEQHRRCQDLNGGVNQRHLGVPIPA